MCLWLPSILVNKKSQALLSLAFWLTTHRLTSYRWQSLPHPRSSLYCNADGDDLQYRLHIIDFDARRSAKEALKDFCLRLAQLAARLWQPGSTGSSSSIYSSWIRKTFLLRSTNTKKNNALHTYGIYRTRKHSMKWFCKTFLFYRVLYSTGFSMQAEYVMLSSFLFIRIPQQKIIFFGLKNIPFLAAGR